MDIEKLELMGSGEAYRYIGVSRVRFNELIGKYQIPHKKLMCGFVFLKADLDAFMEKRKGVEKYKRK